MATNRSKADGNNTTCTDKGKTERDTGAAAADSAGIRQRDAYPWWGAADILWAARGRAYAAGTEATASDD